MKREMAMIAVAVLVLGVVAVEGKHAAAPAPAPAVDCSTLVFQLIDCLSFVTNGSTDVKPTAGCCTGLKTVLRTDAQCLCDEFKSSASLGVSLNLTKALTLPDACHVSAPSIKNCGVTVSPTGAPASSPAGAPELSAPGSTGASAPSPTAGKNTSPALGVSLSSVVLCLVGAIFSSL